MKGFQPGVLNPMHREKLVPQSGRSRALRAVPELGDCEECGAPAVDRHHRDGDTTNNDLSNIAQLCRRCHMIVDGRMGKRDRLGRYVPDAD